MTAKMPTILRAIVLENGRTVKQAAQMLGIGRPALSSVLNGHADLSLELAVRIEDVFRYSALALLEHQLEIKLAEYRQRVGSCILPTRNAGQLVLERGAP
jgi:plasmid maintenance system antidote protein VapI